MRLSEPNIGNISSSSNLVEGWYSLEQYIGFEGRQAFIHYCGLHQVWLEAEKLSTYIRFGSLRSVKSVKTNCKLSIRSGKSVKTNGN